MTIALVFAAAFGSGLASVHLGWKLHRAFLRQRRDVFCEHCGRITLRTPSFRDPIDSLKTPPPEEV